MAVDSDGTLTLVDQPPEDCSLAQFEEKHGVTNFDQTGKTVCGRERYNTAGGKRTRLCANDAGWGTDHFGYGPCVTHGGVSNGMISKDNLTVVVENEQLRAILAAEYENQSVDSLDDEIILLKAMIKMLASTFAVKVHWDADDAVVMQGDEDMQGWKGLSEQAKEISRIIMLLANTLKNKYQILQISRETIPREQVRAYINQVIALLQNSLRNTCERCGHEHGSLNNVIAGMDIIGGI